MTRDQAVAIVAQMTGGGFADAAQRDLTDESLMLLAECVSGTEDINVSLGNVVRDLRSEGATAERLHRALTLAWMLGRSKSWESPRGWGACAVCGSPRYGEMPDRGEPFGPGWCSCTGEFCPAAEVDVFEDANEERQCDEEAE